MSVQLVRVGGKIVAFPATRARRNWLTQRDIEVANDWKPRLALCGFDRLEYNGETVCNDPDLQDFLSLYRVGDRWATWSFAREGCHVVAWRNTTGPDLGRVVRISMDATIRTVLRLSGAPVEEVANEDDSVPINVIPFPRVGSGQTLQS